MTTATILPPSAIIRPQRDADSVSIMARVIDETVSELNERASVLALMGAGYSAKEIEIHIDEATARVRGLRAIRYAAGVVS